jgi:hypothetical protein
LIPATLVSSPIAPTVATSTVFTPTTALALARLSPPALLAAFLAFLTALLLALLPPLLTAIVAATFLLLTRGLPAAAASSLFGGRFGSDAYQRGFRTNPQETLGGLFDDGYCGFVAADAELGQSCFNGYIDRGSPNFYELHLTSPSAVLFLL